MLASSLVVGLPSLTHHLSIEPLWQDCDVFTQLHISAHELWVSLALSSLNQIGLLTVLLFLHIVTYSTQANFDCCWNVNHSPVALARKPRYDTLSCFKCFQIVPTTVRVIPLVLQSVSLRLLQTCISDTHSRCWGLRTGPAAPRPSWPAGGQRERLNKSRLHKKRKKGPGRRSSWELTLPGQPQTVHYRGLTWFLRSPGTSNKICFPLLFHCISSIP